MSKKSGRKVYHVIHNSDKGWKVKKDGASRASDYFDKKPIRLSAGKNWQRVVEKVKSRSIRRTESFRPNILMGMILSLKKVEAG